MFNIIMEKIKTTVLCLNEKIKSTLIIVLNKSKDLFNKAKLFVVKMVEIVKQHLG